MIWYSPRSHKFGFTGAKILALTTKGELIVIHTDRNGNGQMFSDNEGNEWNADEILLYSPIELPIYRAYND